MHIRMIMVFVLGIMPLCGAMDRALSEKIVAAHNNPADPFSVTFVYEYDARENAFLKIGDLTSLTEPQIQTITDGSFYYKDFIGRHRTRLSQVPAIIGALVLGKDRKLQQRFDEAYNLKITEVVIVEELSPSGTNGCNVVNFNRLECFQE